MGDGKRANMTQIRNTYRILVRKMRKGTSLNTKALMGPSE